MSTGKIRMIFICLLFGLLFLNPVKSQTITSTAAGGGWGSGSTWVGGVVPGSNNDVIIAGNVNYQNGAGTCRNLTVNAGASLFNQTGYAWGEQILTVNGNVTNNGTIRSAGNLFVVKIKGNIINNGTWTFRRTELIGSGTQTISSANNSRFENYILVDAVAKPAIALGSDVTFTTSFDLSKSTMDAKNFKITLLGESANISNGTVNNVGTVHGLPAFDQYRNAYFPIINDVTYNGTITVRGRIRINGSVVMTGSVVNTDTLENSTGYAHPEKKLQINGSFTNNGMVRNGGSAGFALNITGNVTNNGTWVHNRTELSGTSNQTLSLGSGKLFESPFKVTDLTGMIVAGSELTFTSWFDLNKCAFDMKNYLLVLKGESANISNGIIFDIKELKGQFTKDNYGNPYYPIVDNITYDGNINLKGILRINSNVTLRGNVTVTDTIQNSTGYAHPEKVLKIIGDLTNNGVIRDGGSAGFVLDVTGNIKANKIIQNKRVQLSGSGNRTIYDRLSSVLYYSTGEKVILYGENYLSNFSIAASSKCLLAADSHIHVPNDNIDEALDNWGDISITRKFTSSLSYPFFKANVNVISNSNIDSVKIQSFGHQVPPTFAGAVKCWWRVKAFSKNQLQSFASMTFRYNNDLLGTNTESALQIYNSTDEGITWRQISTTSNTTRDLNNNSITLADAPGYGDYLLSSTSDPSSVSPSILSTIVGTSNIRIAAPTRLTVRYVNNSDAPAQDCLITVNTGLKVHIKSVEVPMSSGGFMSLPKDSLFFENEDTTLVMYALNMAPREERSFDIVVVGDNPSLGKGAFIDPISVTVGATVTWVAWKAGTWAVCKGIDYLGDKLNKGLKMSPEEQARYDQMVRGGIPTELEQRKGGMRTFAEKQVAVQIAKKAFAAGVPGQSLVQVTYTVTENAKVIAPTLRQRIFNWFYKETGLYGVETTENGNTYQPTVSTVTQKKGKLVTSWDPNEKVGPEGFGDKKYITSAGKMTYQILFENKKEATAAAYRIVIIDTLQSVFDPETVEFGKTSHEGNQYNWVMTRTGNILRWEIEGIELPPNQVPPEGEGWVSFTVNTKSNLPSGTELKNRATITFDVNKPINTNEYVNTLDFNAPVTTMIPLPSAVKNNELVVKWHSNDGTSGSGIESSTIFMSVDQAPFDLVGVSNSDSLSVALLPGTHTYSFYALAKDNVGNVEIVKPTVVTRDIANSVESLDDSLPVEYSLGQNYPNPFNPVTAIRFSLPNKSRVLLEVFNVLGQRVEVLIDKELDASTYKVDFNAKRLSSGIYFYRLISDNFVQTKKMMLLK